MNLPSRWLALVANTVVLWEESGENLGIFCYFISWGTFTNLRSRTLALIPYAARQETVCFIPSFTSFTHFTTRKGLDS
jgi:hypothetical protein